MNVSPHAYERAWERLGWYRATTERMAIKAFCHGIHSSDVSGALHRYLEECADRHGRDCLRVYGEHLYIFEDCTLITVFRLPRELRKTANHETHRRRD